MCVAKVLYWRGVFQVFLCGILLTELCLFGDLQGRKRKQACCLKRTQKQRRCGSRSRTG